MPIKFLNASGSGTTSDAVDAINYAALMHVRVMSNSWGGGGFSQALFDAMQAASDSGIVFVAAAGNASTNNDFTPNYPVELRRAEPDRRRGDRSQRPARGFLELRPDHGRPRRPRCRHLQHGPGNNYTSLNGTSMATPHVAGAAALVISRFPGITPAALRTLLLDRADRIPALAGRTVSGGRLNVFMPIADPDSTAPGAITDLALSDVDGSRVRLAWTATGDDGAVGRASHYEIRYSTVPITEDNFSAATPAFADFDPAESGSPEASDVTGLVYETHYYFAIKAFDEFSNPGPISNVPSATTLAGPHITVSPLALHETLLNGQTADVILTIGNTGVSDLHFDISSASPALAGSNPPRIVRTFPPRRTPEPVYIDLPGFKTTPYATRRAGRLVTEESAPVRGMSPMIGGALRVLIVEASSDVGDIQRLIGEFPDISLVDVYHAGGSTPSLGELTSYDVVLVANSSAFGDGDALGNVLADFVDTGGGVVLTTPSTVAGFHVGGRFLAGGYSPFELGTGPVGGASLGTFNAGHPIMQGVTGCVGDALALNELSPGAELVASWSTAQPFVATKGSNVVAVNVFVGFSGYWTGDIPLILHNAIQWTSHPVFVSTLPDSGVVGPGESLGVVVRFDAADLDGGTYDAILRVHSDDATQPVVNVSAQLTVIGAPNLLVHGEPIVVSSTKEYSESGAITVHQLLTTTPPAGGGQIKLRAEGDYGFSPEIATLTVEGVVLGGTTPAGTDCAPSNGTFELSAAQLAAFLSDGVVDCQVVNDPQVDVFCSPNRHTVELRYDGPAETLAFGALFLGLHKDLTIMLENAGTEVLHVNSIDTGSPLFVASPTSVTIPPRASAQVTVRYQPTGVGTNSATLHIVSDDPDTPAIDIAMTGEGVEPPIAGVEPSSITLTLDEGQSDHRALHVSNTGASPLHLTVEVRGGSTANLVASRFAGLGGIVTAPSNNTAAATNVLNEIERAGEPNYRALTGEFEARASSPVPLTCVVEDPTQNRLYGQANFGSAFYRYSPVDNSWQTLASSPIFAGNNGGAAYLNGRVYTVYTDNTALGVYDIASNGWVIRSNPLPRGTCDITSDGSQFLYLCVGVVFGRLDPATTVFEQLAAPPFPLEPWGGMRYRAGTVYAHQGNGQRASRATTSRPTSGRSSPPSRVARWQDADRSRHRRVLRLRLVRRAEPVSLLDQPRNLERVFHPAVRRERRRNGLALRSDRHLLPAGRGWSRPRAHRDRARLPHGIARHRRGRARIHDRHRPRVRDQRTPRRRLPLGCRGLEQ